MNTARVTKITEMGTQARTELDTGADTSCTGVNFWLHDLTWKTCSVAPFSKAYDPIPNVKNVTCLTAYDDYFGRT